MDRGSLIWATKDEAHLNELVKDHPFFGGFLLASELFDGFRREYLFENPRRFRAHAYMDVHVNNGLDRLLTGRITSLSDLQCAELALYSLLLHENTDVILPSALVSDSAFMAGFKGYCALRPQRSDTTAEVMQLCKAMDLIYAPEFCNGSAGKIVESSLKHSLLINQQYDGMAFPHFEVSGRYLEDLALFPQQLDGYAYLGDSAIDKALLECGVISALRKRLSEDWTSEWNRISHRSLTIVLPPLIAILFQRCQSRDDLPKEIIKLRDELSEVRRELRNFDEQLRAVGTVADIAQTHDRIMCTFKHIVPSVFRTNIEHRAQTICWAIDSLFGLKDLFTPKGLQNATKRVFRYDRDFHAGKPPRRIMNSTVTSKTIGNLLRVEGMEELCNDILYQDEIDKLRRDLLQPSRR